KRACESETVGDALRIGRDEEAEIHRCAVVSLRGEQRGRVFSANARVRTEGEQRAVARKCYIQLRTLNVQTSELAKNLGIVRMLCVPRLEGGNRVVDATFFPRGVDAIEHRLPVRRNPPCATTMLGSRGCLRRACDGDRSGR